MNVKKFHSKTLFVNNHIKIIAIIYINTSQPPPSQQPPSQKSQQSQLSQLPQPSQLQPFFKSLNDYFKHEREQREQGKNFNHFIL